MTEIENEIADIEVMKSIIMAHSKKLQRIS